MFISVATANYYHLPFEQTLEIIALSGFQNIELDLFWEHKGWAMAQHLRGVAPREVVRQIHQAGLTVTSIHDGGGVLDGPDTIRGLINPQLVDYLDCLGYAPDNLAFHTPHIEGALNGDWWRGFSSRVATALEPYRATCRCLTIENMPFFDGYFVPLTTPEALMEFVTQTGLGVTLDTTHYAQIGVDITLAAKTLYGKVNTIHLSDYQNGSRHIYPGDGELDFSAFFKALDAAALYSVTLESSPVRAGEHLAGMETAGYIKRLTLAQQRLKQMVQYVS